MGIVLADQGSKAILSKYDSARLLVNADVAFSLPVPWWGVLIALCVLVSLLVYMVRSWDKSTTRRAIWSVGLVLGGALSNLLDRWLVGGVRDFIDLKVWPVFNIADIGLTVGTVALLWYALTSTSHGSKQGEKSASGPRGQH